MGYAIRSALVALLLTVGAAHPANAGPYEDGLAAAGAEDYPTALRLWRPLADQGHAGAQNNLGFMFANGRGVPQDDVQAVKWYRLAADQGNASAQFFLGLIYDPRQKWRGVRTAVQQDPEKWYRLAADQGYAEAQYNLGAMGLSDEWQHVCGPLALLAGIGLRCLPGHVGADGPALRIAELHAACLSLGKCDAGALADQSGFQLRDGRHLGN